MHRGQTVQVKEAFNNKQLKKVVAWDEKYIFVCREEEYLAAAKEKREPNAIGFSREFVKEVAI